MCIRRIQWTFKRQHKDFKSLLVPAFRFLSHVALILTHKMFNTWLLLFLSQRHIEVVAAQSYFGYKIQNIFNASFLNLYWHQTFVHFYIQWTQDFNYISQNNFKIPAGNRMRQHKRIEKEVLLGFRIVVQCFLLRKDRWHADDSIDCLFSIHLTWTLYYWLNHIYPAHLNFILLTQPYRMAIIVFQKIFERHLTNSRA